MRERQVARRLRSLRNEVEATLLDRGMARALLYERTLDRLYRRVQAYLVPGTEVWYMDVRLRIEETNRRRTVNCYEFSGRLPWSFSVFAFLDALLKGEVTSAPVAMDPDPEYDDE